MVKVISAGIGYSEEIAVFDFESYSEAGYYWDGPLNRFRAPDGFPKGKTGIQSIGAARYAEDPTTEILSLAYDLKDGSGPILWVPGMAPPTHLFDYLAQDGALIEAFNVLFEFWIWQYVAHDRMGWPELPLDKLRCAKAKAGAWGLPNSLDNVTKVLHSHGY